MRTVSRRLQAAAAVVSGIALFALSTTAASAAPSEEPSESDAESRSSTWTRPVHLNLSWTRTHAHFNDVAPEELHRAIPCSSRRRSVVVRRERRITRARLFRRTSCVMGSFVSLRATSMYRRAPLKMTWSPLRSWEERAPTWVSAASSQRLTTRTIPKELTS